MAELCGTRIRYIFCVLFHLVGSDLTVGVEEGGESSGRSTHGVLNLVLSTCVTCLVSEDLDQFKRSMATTSALGRWSLGALARRLPTVIKYVRQALVVAPRCVGGSLLRWSKDLNVNTTRKTAIGSTGTRSTLYMWCAAGIYP
jgi:hypothetical protein